MIDAEWFEVVGRHGIRRQHRVAADPHSGSDERAGADPRAGPDDDRFDDEVECRRLVVVASRAQESALRDANMTFDRDRCEVEQPGILAKPHVVSQSEPPGKGDAHVGLDDDARSDFRAETLQRAFFQPGEFQRAKAKQQQRNKQPEPFFDNASATIKVAFPIGGEINLVGIHGLVD